MHTCQQRTRCGGFALAEASVVLGVVGLVLASIWTTAGMVIQNQKTVQFSQQLSTLVTNVSKMHEGKTDFASSAEEARQFEQTLIAAGTVPEALIDRTTTPPRILTAFGVLSINVGALNKWMNFQFSGVMPVESCIRALRAAQHINTEIASLSFSGYIQMVPCSRTDNSPAELAYCPPQAGLPDLQGIQPEAVLGEAAMLTPRTPISNIAAYCANQNKEGLQAGFEGIFK